LLDQVGWRTYFCSIRQLYILRSYLIFFKVLFHSIKNEFSYFIKGNIRKHTYFYRLKNKSIIILTIFKVFLLLNIKTYIVFTKLFNDLIVLLKIIRWFIAGFLIEQILLNLLLSFLDNLFGWGRRLIALCIGRFWFWLRILFHGHIIIRRILFILLHFLVVQFIQSSSTCSIIFAWLHVLVFVSY